MIPGAAPRLDKYLAEQLPDLTRSYIKRLIERGNVLVNGELAKPGWHLREGDQVQVVVPPPVKVALEAEPIPLKVVYEDRELLVVDKPAGLPVHPSAGHPKHTLVNALLAHCPDLEGIGGEVRPGIVHRLDKDTSGLLMVAKNAQSHASLSQQLKERTIKKGYLALVKGQPAPSQGIIDAPIARDPRNRKRMAVVLEGRQSVTRYEVLERLGSHTLLEVWPGTGRTHQIRVHLASLGHPLAGDSLYGGKAPFTGRQFLHAHILGFHHPFSHEWLEFTSPLPEDLALALEVVRLAA